MNTGTDKGVFIVAELSANHGHKLQTAKDTIKAIKEAGADAVKLQTYTPDTITLDCDNEYFQIKQQTIWDGTTLYKLYQEAYTPWEWQRELFEYARELGLTVFSTPFDKTSVDFLEELENPIYKIASFEINDLPLLEYVASKGKPMIISTGIATIGEIK
ncbi:MAG: N-acetylneuraminate synthase family protein, partial [Peptococcia bacterium]